MSQPDTKGDFKLILNHVRPDALAAVARELIALFPLDLPNALNIARNTPIILLDKLNAHQARNVSTYATRLKALGADVTITGQPVGKLQVLRWPLLPELAKRPGNQLICPSCGARLQVQVHPGGEPAPAAEAAQANQTVTQQPAGIVKEELVLGPASEEPEELSDEEVILEEASAKAGENPHAPQAARAVGGQGTFRVLIVGKIKGEKKQNAAELMAEYLGIGKDEAVAQLNSRTVVSVARELTEEQAAECKNRFTSIGVKVTVKG